jgi:hypothetical protein
MIDRLTDEQVQMMVEYPNAAWTQGFVDVLAREVQERRNMRCDTCRWGEKVVQEGITCVISNGPDALNLRFDNPPDWFCADWQAKP